MMDIAAPETDRCYSREDYRRWAAAQPRGRFERVDGRIVAMAPERGAHLRIKRAVYRALHQAVRAAGINCQALPDGATVETGDSDYAPDVLVNCGPPLADDAIAAPNPVVVVEVFSPGTASTDTGAKLADYFRVPSIAHRHPAHNDRSDHDGPARYHGLGRGNLRWVAAHDGRAGDIAAPMIWDRHGAVFERHAYLHEGLKLVAWVIRPPGPGPFPLLVINHGSGAIVGSDGRLKDVSSLYTPDPENPAWARTADNGALNLFPEGRGYGGSEAPSPMEAMRGGHDTTYEMLLGRASDANAAADWACTRPDVDGGRCVIGGASHGAVVSLLAAAQRPYGAVVAQATGAAYGRTEASVRLIANAAARITAPVLFQHMRTDTLVPLECARTIFDWSSRFLPLQRWRDYPGVPGIEGHNVFDPANRQQLQADSMETIRAGFDATPSAPEDPPEQWTVLDFLLPVTLGVDVPRWHGRFGESGPDAPWWRLTGTGPCIPGRTRTLAGSLRVQSPARVIRFPLIHGPAYQCGWSRCPATLFRSFLTVEASVLLRASIANNFALVGWVSPCDTHHFSAARAAMGVATFIHHTN